MAAVCADETENPPPFAVKMKWNEYDDVSEFNTAETLLIDGGEDELSREFRQYADKAAAEEKARYEAYKAKRDADLIRSAEAVAPSKPVRPLVLTRLLGREDSRWVGCRPSIPSLPWTSNSQPSLHAESWTS
jgi:hypothetical protein